MTPLAMFGILLTVLAVLAAYWVGHSAGFKAGQEHGFGEGKRKGSREGSMRGYAVGFDRGRRETTSGDGDEPARRGLGFGVVALAGAALVVFFLASQSRKQVGGPNHREQPTRPFLREVQQRVPVPVERQEQVDVARPMLPVPVNK